LAVTYGGSREEFEEIRMCHFDGQDVGLILVFERIA
jgi:hypothetical protein